MAGRINNKYNATIRVNGIDVTVNATTPEELGHKIIAIQKPVVGTARQTRTYQDYQSTKPPMEEQVCRYGMNCTQKESGRCTRKHLQKEDKPPQKEEPRSRTNSASSTEAPVEKPVGFCKFGQNCKNKTTTCKFRHNKPCKAFKEGECKYADNCKFTH